MLWTLTAPPSASNSRQGREWGSSLNYASVVRKIIRNATSAKQVLGVCGESRALFH